VSYGPVRWSGLKLMAKSPMHYRDALDVGVTVTGPMRIGTAADAYIFGLADPIVFDGTRRGKVWDAFCAEHDGELVVSVAENDAARRIADSVLANRDAMAVLRGEHRTEINWTFNGRAAISHPDCFDRTARYITDLKTSMTSDPMRFPHHARRMHYIAQLAFYRAALLAAEGWRARDCYIVAVEQARPFVTTVFRLTEAALVAGEKLNRLWVERVIACEATDEWPPYIQSVAELDVEDDEFELTFADEPETAEFLAERV
jgi:hypothetical protein